ncbi:MAG: hypothetical protein IPQ07_39560 [Myxococcales bacterium]|nr:hypothetical protein [Myxococcales bacterium]
MRAQLPLALLAALPFATTVGCVADSSTQGVDEIASALEQDNGGLDTTDEAPMFAAETAFDAAQIETDTVEADPMAADPTIVEMARPGSAVEARDLIVMWGRFPADRATTTGRDWSGELRLSRGGMLLRHKIAFEQATDRVMPRTSRDAISFVSVTRPAADGLALTVFDPQPGTVNALTLTYTPVSGAAHAVDLAQLANGPIVIDAGDGNKILIAGHRRNDDCAHGFIRGRWHALSPNASAYLGVVANSDGDAVGHIRGIAGTRRNGEPVMFGKFINREGQFMGLVKGTYEDGKFVARWLDRQGDHGQLHGVYFPGPNERAGGFLGRWSETSCGAN